MVEWMCDGVFQLEASAELTIVDDESGSDLDRDDLVIARVVRLVDGTHAAGADLFQQLVIAIAATSVGRQFIGHAILRSVPRTGKEQAQTPSLFMKYKTESAFCKRHFCGGRWREP